MAAQSNQTASPQTAATAADASAPGGRALRAIADELRRIGDALSRTANHVTAAVTPGGEEDGPAPTPQEEALFQSLREWRANEARKLGMPPYIVATDKALRALAQRRPATVEELKGIPGFGPAKAAKYGPDVVGVVAGA